MSGVTIYFPTLLHGVHRDNFIITFYPQSNRLWCE